MGMHACRYASAAACLPAPLMHHLDLADTLAGWAPGEVAAFEALLGGAWKDFDVIAARLPGKTTPQVVRFYYDVWKMRRLPQAARWYARRQEASGWTLSIVSATQKWMPMAL